jgi:hypothetical protein
MSKTLYLQTRIMIPAQSVVIVPRMMFSGWFPTTEADFLVVSEHEMTLKLWFDASCTLTKEINTTPSAANAGNSIKADVTISGLSDHLAEYIRAVGLKPLGPLEQSQDKEDFSRLGTKVCHFVITHVNRLISAVRSLQGQFWLEELVFDPNQINSPWRLDEAKASVDGLEWFRWYPPSQPITSYIPPRMDSSRFIDESAWRRIVAIATSPKRVPLMWRFLADADLFAANGDSRAALVEGVTALEMAVSRFVQSPKANEVFGRRMAERMGVSRLTNQKERLGLRGTVRFLFAVIFSEDMVSTQLLQICQDAIDERNEVVHNGKSEVEPEKLSSYLSSIRQLCAFLGSYQQAEH